MLYQWKFTVLDKDGNTLRTDSIIAPTVTDADFIYKHNIAQWSHDELKVLYYIEGFDEKPELIYSGPYRIENKIQIDCLGEVEVKLVSETPPQNRVTVLFESLYIDHYTSTFTPALIVNGEFLQWGFSESNRSIALVKILEDVFHSSMKSEIPLIPKGQVMSIFPFQLRFI